MKWDDFSEFFEERRDFFSTLKNWRKFRSYAAVYFFLVDPLEKVGRMETDIVYIGETKHMKRFLQTLLVSSSLDPKT